MGKGYKILFWLPRILAILAILFISMFALDAFQHGITLWQQIVAFLMHLVPSFILLAVLIIAWKRELLGGIIFLILGLGISPFVFLHNYQMNQSVWMSLGIISMITFPFVLVGVLFLVGHRPKKKQGTR
ncbi:hypothetical protein ACA086_14070 [Muriicola sp. E247]|uniref:DUF7670 domain-containing protein n=1 Tax=Muriicola sp. E247 TaxID=3242730 RepID=UPI003523A40F